MSGVSDRGGATFRACERVTQELMERIGLDEFIAKKDDFAVGFLGHDPQGLLHFRVPGLVDCEEALAEGGQGGVQPGRHVDFGVGEEAGEGLLQLTGDGS